MATFLSANVVRQAPPEGGATTRRKLLGGVAALPAAGALAAFPLSASAAVGSRAAAADPTLALCRRYWAIDTAQEAIDERLKGMRVGLVAQWGEPTNGHWWPDDAPGVLELRRLLDVSADMSVQLCDLVAELIKTPATTAAGVAAKLRIALAQFSPPPAAEWHEEVAWAFMADAARLLEAGRVA